MFTLWCININMAPKKTKKTATRNSARGQCRGKKNTSKPSSSPSSSKAADPPAHDLPAVHQAGRPQSPRSPSPPSGDASRASSVDSVAFTSSRQPDDKIKKKRRASWSHQGGWHHLYDLSNMPGLSGLMNVSPGMEMENQDADMNTPPPSANK